MTTHTIPSQDTNTLPRGWRRMIAAKRAAWVAAQITENVKALNNRSISVDEFHTRQRFAWGAAEAAGPKTTDLVCSEFRRLAGLPG